MEKEVSGKANENKGRKNPENNSRVGFCGGVHFHHGINGCYMSKPHLFCSVTA